MPFVLFGGYFINIETVPYFLQPIQYISLFRYGYEALAIVIWRDITLDCDELIQTCLYETGDQVLEDYSLNSSNLLRDVFILISLYISFMFLSFIFIYKRAKRARNHLHV